MQTADSTGPVGQEGLGSELKQDAQKLGGIAGDRLSEQADSHKGEIASQARSVSDALEKVAGEDTPDWLRSSLRQGAETLQRLADTVDRKDPRELVGDLNSLGRDHPGAFLGACAVAGFAAARVIRAGVAGSQSATTGYPSGTGLPGASPSFGAGESSLSSGGWSGQGSSSGQTGAGQSYASSAYGAAGKTHNASQATGYTEGAV